MQTIIFSPTAQLSQVDDFPVDCERSVKGAIHVRPGASATVTEREAEHLKKKGIPFAYIKAAKPLPTAKVVQPGATPEATAATGPKTDLSALSGPIAPGELLPGSQGGEEK